MQHVTLSDIDHVFGQTLSLSYRGLVIVNAILHFLLIIYNWFVSTPNISGKVLVHGIPHGIRTFVNRESFSSLFPVTPNSFVLVSQTVRFHFYCPELSVYSLKPKVGFSLPFNTLIRIYRLIHFISLNIKEIIDLRYTSHQSHVPRPYLIFTGNFSNKSLGPFFHVTKPDVSTLTLSYFTYLGSLRTSYCGYRKPF